jgi:hypothetical protein
VSQYISTKYPGLTLSSTNYQPAAAATPTQVQESAPVPVPEAVPAAVIKESFGAVATCDTTKSMVIFILVAFAMYIFFGVFFEN